MMQDPLQELAPYIQAARETGESFIPPAELSEALLASRSTPVAERDLPRAFGPYTLEAILGSGASGTVYRAYDGQLDRHIAVKILAPELAALPDSRERFLREARAAANLHHDHLMPLYAVHEDTPSPCLTAPLLVGETLQNKLTRKITLPINEVVTLARQIALGLQHAHHAGILHRDIKPSNIFLEEVTARAIIMDFGLARSLHTPSDLTLTGAIAGTPEFLAPEQIDDSPQLTPATDLYSLGATLYTLISGSPPFKANSITSLLKKVSLDLPTQLNDTPDWLNELVLSLLAKDPADRPASAEAFINLLDKKTAAPKQYKCSLWIVAALLTVSLILFSAWKMTQKTDAPPFSLQQAIASGKKTITIPNSGTYILAPLHLTHDLTLTAKEPGTIIRFSSGELPGITTQGNLTLNNLIIVQDTPKDLPVPNLIVTQGKNLTITHCRIEQAGSERFPFKQRALIRPMSPITCQIKHTAILAHRSYPIKPTPSASGSHFTFTHAVIHAACILDTTTSDGHTLILDHTTSICLAQVRAARTQYPTKITATHNHLESHLAFLWTPNAINKQPVIWSGDHNTFATRNLWKSNNPQRKKKLIPFKKSITSFAEWKSTWESDPNSKEVQPVLMDRDLRNKSTNPSQTELKNFTSPYATGAKLSTLPTRTSK